MLLSGFSLITMLAIIARRELAAIYKDTPQLDGPQKGPQAPISTGLRRLRLAGSSSSIDFGHHRAFSRNFTSSTPIEE